jgi:DNA-binding transcriptional regulator YhcF (GntR family)
MNTFKIRHSAPLVSAIETIIDTRVIKKGLGRTLQALAIHWSPKGKIFPSQDRLAALTGLDRRTIVTHIQLLKDAGAIRVLKRPNIIINGQQVRQTMVYEIIESFIGAMFKKARMVLKEAAKKKALKDHLAPSKKDHINSSYEQGKDLKNTVSVNATRGFLEKRYEAIRSELEHLGKIATDSAYKAVTKRNQIARGERLSDEEAARRKAMAAKNAPVRAKAMSVSDKVRSYETALLTWNATKTGFTKAMYTELTTVYQSMVSNPMAKIVLSKFAAQHNALF